MRLVDVNVRLNADALVKRFIPPPRFASATFGTYQPDPKHHSQKVVLGTLKHYAAVDINPPRKHWFSRVPKQAPTRGIYLDGGYGVGKTHLLVALWHAWFGSKAYATFTELTAFIGFCGMSSAVEAFRKFQLICIDEFELDDVANTLMVVSFLKALSDGNIRIAVTSNTLPDRLGEQRFSAADFRREIAAIASYFDEYRIDGDDFRVTHHSEASAVRRTSTSGTGTEDDFAELKLHLRQVHPVNYGAMLDNIDAVVINDVRMISEQDDALLFVQLVDKLYDADIPVQLNGCAIDEIFAKDYRHGGYRKKYGRAESRLQAMNQQA